MLKLILTAPTDPAKNREPRALIVRASSSAYIALNAGKTKLAYDLIKDAGPLSVNPAKEQAFMAGWIALRLLKDPKAAEAHYNAMRMAADGPLSRAKALYWLARIAKSRGDQARAKEYFKEAAIDGDTFHGLLARLKIDPSNSRHHHQAAAATNSRRDRRLQQARRRAGYRHRAAWSLDTSVVRAFLYQLRNVKEDKTQGALIAHLADALGETQTGLRIAKTAIAKRQNLLYYSYPIHPFPAYTPLRVPPEPAFLLGMRVRRQSSTS